MAPRDAERDEFLSQAGKLYDQMMARSGAGSGDTFDDIELQALRAARELAESCVAKRLAQEEKAASPEIPCPKCRRPMRRPKTPAPRVIQTMAGDVRYERRHAICDRCGASFSPSGPKAQDSGAGGVRPPGAKRLRGEPGGVV
jgi:hypothetical protein